MRVPEGKSCEWVPLGWCWGCDCPWGPSLPTCFVFPSSPFMNKFFPANFPNRQYQLLFTQGSGENKEGQCCPLSLALGISHLRSPLSPNSGLSNKASDGKGGLSNYTAWAPVPTLLLPTHRTLGERLYLSEPWVFCWFFFFSSVK